MTMRNRLIYQLFIWIILIISLGGLIFLTMRAVNEERWLASDDYVEYWAAGRLNITGGNPYNPDELLPLQHQAGRFEGVPLMMWNPPWMLVIAMPFGMLDYTIGRTIWLFLSMTIIIVCSDIIWGFYGGQKQKRWLSWLIGLSFVPALDVLRRGQTAAFILLGIVGFLYFLYHKKEWLAGVCLSLLAIKPHILLLFTIALLIWCVQNRRWRLILGCLCTLVSATLITVVINPSIIQHYIFAITNYPPEQWATPTIGSILRVIINPELFWLQFVPTLLGILWLLYHWHKNYQEWNWFVQAPLLTLISMCTSAYGWTFDYPIFILPIISTFAKLNKLPSPKTIIIITISYIAINVIDYLMRVPQIWLWWLAPSLLIWYLISNHKIQQSQLVTTPPFGETVV